MVFPKNIQLCEITIEYVILYSEIKSEVKVSYSNLTFFSTDDLMEKNRKKAVN